MIILFGFFPHIILYFEPYCKCKRAKDIPANKMRSRGQVIINLQDA